MEWPDAFVVAVDDEAVFVYPAGEDREYRQRQRRVLHEQDLWPLPVQELERIHRLLNPAKP